MRILMCLALLALAAAVSGCASVRPWMSGGGGPVKVSWHEEEGKPFVSDDGVCHLFAQDRDEKSLESMGAQMIDCTRGSLPMGKTYGSAVSKIVHMKLHFVTKQEVTWRFVDEYGLRFFKARSHVVVYAFYLWNDGVCHIVYNDAVDIGHEIKHCYKGPYHDIYGKWLKLTIRGVSPGYFLFFVSLGIFSMFSQSS